MSPEETRSAALLQAFDQWVRAYARLDQDLRTPIWTRERHYRNASKHMREQTVHCCVEFARERGWRWHPMSGRTESDIRRAGFPSWRDLRPDCVDAFYCERQVIALAVHVSRPMFEVEQFARAQGLQFEPLQLRSWYMPRGEVSVALLTLPTAATDSQLSREIATCSTH